MAEDPQVDQERPMPAPERVAKRWLRIRGIEKPSQDREKGKVDPSELVNEAYDLFVEREDLRAAIVTKERQVMEEPQRPLSLEEKKRLITQGRVSAVPLTSSEESATEVIGRSQERAREIDNRLEQIFSAPGAYQAFTENLTRQVRARQQAREVRSLEQFANSIDILAARLAREATVKGAALTSVERKIIGEHQELKQTANERRQELLRDPNVFDRVRVLELKDYRRQLRSPGHFAETPSRKEYLRRIEGAWSEAKKVLLTGETGTGKTEIVKHASQALFGVSPESVTGHQDMSIYELLGKTGFQVQVGDVFRPAPLIRAMTGRDGYGMPFLFDELDRAPNQAVMSIKTILNARPGEKGLRVQTDTAGTFDVGPDYAVAATANIKSEKYATATELDPAIVRVFDAPMDIDYMPPWEVYDLALASVMEAPRGGVPLSEQDAKVLLKSLCDAASWIQDAYQGRKVVTNPRTGEFLEARGQATTGKPASLRKALLDPGRTIEMLKGWATAEAQGTNFEEYLNERIVAFINNRAYPEEDRYYLIEIFALKGFLKGRKASEFLVSGLTQETLSRWTGTTRARRAKKTERAYLPPERVAKLDPYRKLKRPVSAEAEELLEEELEGEEGAVEGTTPELDRAREILGQDFLGPEAIRNMESKLAQVGQNVEFVLGDIPPLPYTERDLEIARQDGEMLVLRPAALLVDGRELPIALINFRELWRRDPVGQVQYVFFSFSHGANYWYARENFAAQEELRAGWALVKKEILAGSTGKSWNDQQNLLQQYSEGLKLKGANNINIRRRTAVETAWDTLLYYTHNAQRLLGDKYDWGQTRASDGGLVIVGGFEGHGLRVSRLLPDGSSQYIGVVPSR